MSDCMGFPEKVDDFINWYKFTDTEEYYTNGSELIQVFRVKQMLENYMPKWIPVSERLPQIGQIVLVHQIFSWEKCEDGAAVTIGRLRPVPPDEKPYWEFQHYRPDFRSGTIMDNDIICPGSKYVTHWMPLPEPPKEGE